MDPTHSTSFRRGVLVAMAAWALSAIASLEDLAGCDPLKKDSSCPPDAAFAGSSSFDFSAASSLDDESLTSFWRFEGSADDAEAAGLESGTGVVLTLSDAGQERATLASEQYLFFGKVSFEAKAAEGQGVVTALTLKSDSGDEILWELLGAYDTQAQTNYFYNGEALFNTYNTTYDLASPGSASSTNPLSPNSRSVSSTSSGSSSSVTADFHIYTIEWTQSGLAFSIDGTLHKSWQPGGIPAEKWPRLPMRLRLSVWAVDEAADQGLIDWAGGLPQWEGQGLQSRRRHQRGIGSRRGHETLGREASAAVGPFRAYVRRVDVEDHVGGCVEAEDGVEVEYVYDERTAAWEDVQVIGCKQRTAPDGSPIAIPTDQPAATPTSGDEDGASPEETGSGEGGDGDNDDGGGGGEEAGDSEDSEDAASWSYRLPSTLGAVICLGWMLTL